MNYDFETIAKLGLNEVVLFAGGVVVLHSKNKYSLLDLFNRKQIQLKETAV